MTSARSELEGRGAERSLAVAPAEVARMRAATRAEWAAAWLADPHATYVCSLDWAEIWEGAGEARLVPRPRLVRFADGKSAVLPLVVRRHGAGLLRTSHLSWPETPGGWLSADALDARHAAALAALLVERCGSLRWKVGPFDPLAPTAAEGVARRPGVAVEPDETLALDLSEGFDALRRRWSKGHRAAESQARRLGVRVRPASGEADWRAYYALFEASQRRWGERAFFRWGWPLFARLSTHSWSEVRLWLAEHEGRPVAGHVFLCGRDGLADWHGATAEAGFPLRAANLLLAEVIRGACAEGERRWLDLGSSGELEGVRAFKRGFGPRAFACPTLVVESRWRRTVRAAARRFRGDRS